VLYFVPTLQGELQPAPGRVLHNVTIRPDGGGQVLINTPGGGGPGDANTICATG
jgi:hypothetical protein